VLLKMAVLQYAHKRLRTWCYCCRVLSLSATQLSHTSILQVGVLHLFCTHQAPVQKTVYTKCVSLSLCRTALTMWTQIHYQELWTQPSVQQLPLLEMHGTQQCTLWIHVTRQSTYVRTSIRICSRGPQPAGAVHSS
jgi:hypothetical protein